MGWRMEGGNGAAPARASHGRANLTRMRPPVFPLGLALFALVPATGSAQSSDGIDVIPRPVSVSAGRGVFRLTGRTVVWTVRQDSAVARRFVQDVAPATGFDLRVRVGAPETSGGIVFRRAPSRDTSLGPEGYHLVVTPTAITISSAAPAGAFYATQTLRQLLPSDIFRDAPIPGVTWTIPAVTIFDRPRFSWRGMHLDVSRHFMPKEFVKKYILPLASHR